MADKSKTALEIKNVTAGYGKIDVVKSICLEVKHGETFGLIGLNGVGKTTLIKAVLGLRDFREGSITIDGRAHDSKESKKHVAFLPERFDPPWYLSGIEFLRFSLSLYGLKREDDFYISAAERLALQPDALKRRVKTYSKGMRQKLGLLATLLTECSLVILDEPMSGLDPLARAHVKDMLKEARDAGRTVFLSSHILADVDEICDSVGVMSGGEIVFEGKPAALKKAGKNDNLERAFLNVIAA